MAGNKAGKRRHTFCLASLRNAVPGLKIPFQACAFLSYRAYACSFATSFCTSKKKWRVFPAGGLQQQDFTVGRPGVRPLQGNLKKRRARWSRPTIRREQAPALRIAHYFGFVKNFWFVARRGRRALRRKQYRIIILVAQKSPGGCFLREICLFNNHICRIHRKHSRTFPFPHQRCGESRRGQGAMPRCGCPQWERYRSSYTSCHRDWDDSPKQ